MEIEVEVKGCTVSEMRTKTHKGNLIEMNSKIWTQFSVWYFFFFSVKPAAYGSPMGKFSGQGSNLCHSSYPSCCNDNVSSLTHCTTKELLVVIIYTCSTFAHVETQKKAKMEGKSTKWTFQQLWGSSKQN